MKQIIVVSVVRFNNQDSQDIACFEPDADTPIEIIKSALAEHFEKIKNQIISPCTEHYEDGESDGHEDDRKHTHSFVIHAIKNAKSLSDFHGHWSLEDGVDIDTDEQIFSHITISAATLKKL